MLGDGSFLQRPIQIQAGVDQLVLSQGPTTLLQVAVWIRIMLFLVDFGGVATLGLIFGSQTQRLVCDRATGTCQLNDRPLAPLAQITGAELRRTWSRSNGTFGITAFLLFLWSRSSITFDRKAGKMTANTKRFLLPAKTKEIGLDQIVAIGDRRTNAGRGVDVRLVDGSRIPLLFARKEGVPDSLLPHLRESLGKPVEERR